MRPNTEKTRKQRFLFLQVLAGLFRSDREEEEVTGFYCFEVR